MLLARGLGSTWLVLGATALALTAVAWFMWPPAQVSVKSADSGEVKSGWFSLQYALLAVGVVPQMVFLVDYIARDLDLGVTVGSRFYLVYGFGAFLGPVLYGAALRFASVRQVLRLAVGIQLVAIILLIMTIKSGAPHLLLVASSALAGLGMPGLVAIFLARSQQIGGGDALKAGLVWGRAITAFSVGQALCGFATAHLIAEYGEQGRGYPILFTFSAAALVLALAVDWRIKD
jgi:predicted MFS family arabinose efflux permease